MSGGERRRQPRFAVNVEFSQLSNDEIVYVSDLSVRGVFVQTTKHLPLDCEVALCFTVLVEDPIVIRCHGRVVRHQQQPSGLGVEFVGLDVQTTAQIRFVVAAQRMRERMEAGEPVSESQRAAMETLRKSPFDAQALKEIDALVNEKPPDRIIVDLEVPIDRTATKTTKVMGSNQFSSDGERGEQKQGTKLSEKPSDSVVALVENTDESEILLLAEGGARTVVQKPLRSQSDGDFKPSSNASIRGALPRVTEEDEQGSATENKSLPGEAGAVAALPELESTEADDDAVTHVFQSPFADKTDASAAASATISSSVKQTESNSLEDADENSCVDRSATEVSGASKN